MIEADANVVQKIVDLAAPIEFTLKDSLGVETKYTSKQVHEVKAAAPALPPTVDVHTLQGFADIIRQKFDADENIQGYVIHVEDEDTVTLKARAADKYGRRHVLAKATPVPFVGFEFGRWQDQESFVIAVAAKFALTDDKNYVLKIASSLTHEATSISEDNGFSQKATIKSGMKVQEIEVLKPTVDLAPYRTFPECRQPISSFVFRARGGDSPTLMLVEADGGKWKIDAINEVRRVLATFEDVGLPIIA